MIDLKISFRCKDFEKNKEEIVSVLEELGWEKTIIFNKLSYGNICNLSILPDGGVGVFINDSDDSEKNEKHALNFLKILSKHRENILCTEIFCNKESSFFVYNYACDAPVNAEDDYSNKYIKINISNIR
jgi:hypothetical protein